MHRRLLAWLSAFVATLVAVPAQDCVAVPGDAPQLGAPSNAPFGNNNPSDPVFSDLRYQVLVPAAMLGDQPRHVCDLQFAPAGSRVRQFVELTVKLAHNAAGQLGNPMSGNLGGPSWTASAWSWSLETTANEWTSFGIPIDFDYDPAFGDLVVELRVRGGGATTGSGTAGFRTDAALPYLWTTGGGDSGSAFSGGGVKMRLCTDAAGLVELRGGCAGSSGLAPRLTFGGSAQRGGPGLVVQLDDAPSVPGFALLVWSFSLRPLPIDLGLLGAPGCTTHLELDLLELVAAPQGTASRALPIPASLPPCIALWVQWAVFDPAANAMGVTSSNQGRALLGA